MKGFAMLGAGKTGWIEKARPTCGALDAIVRPIAVSPCTSDVHTVWEGALGERKDMILGHEAVGEVVEVGSLVRDFRPGDRVIVTAITPDWGSEEAQRGFAMHSSGMLAGWKFSNFKDGVFAEFFHVNEADANMARLPDDLDPGTACMLCDMMPTGFHAAELADIQFGESVCVIGIGPVGLMAVRACVLRGAGDVYCVGTRKNCMDVAAKYGATDFLSYKNGDLAAQILERTRGKGVDKVVVAGGNADTFDAAIRMVKPGGVGTITQDGKFTAASVSKLTEGTIKVSYGQTSVSVPVTVSPANPFSDTKGHWAEDYINDLYFEGTITGSTGKDGKLLYRPDDSMTRQEFVVALMRYLGTNLASYDSVALPFVDSKEIGTWALGAMKAAYSLGYMGGSNELGKLYAHPTATITRQEAMVILARTMQADTGSSVDLDKKFTDSAKIADWAKDSLARMVSAGIISGSNGKLNPTGKVTRAEVAKMLWALENQ